MPDWDAIGIGLAVRDISVLMERFPTPDEKIRATAIHESGGGPVPTALVTMARFGRRTALVAPVGNDAVGATIVRELASEKVDTSALVWRSDFESPTSVIIVDHGRRTILEAPHEVDLPIGWDDIALPLDCRALLVDARAVGAQIRAAREVRRHGGLVMLDCGHPRDGVEELLGCTDIAILSHSYASSARDDPEGFLDWVRGKQPGEGRIIAGVTLGEKGCAIWSREEGYVRLPGEPVTAVDSTGAGDVFHGAFLHAYLERGSAHEAARFANRAAAAKCTGMTGRAPLPDAEALWDP